MLKEIDQKSIVKLYLCIMCIAILVVILLSCLFKKNNKEKKVLETKKDNDEKKVLETKKDEIRVNTDTENETVTEKDIINNIKTLKNI